MTASSAIVYAVIVLYRQTIESSQTARTLMQNLEADPQLSAAISVIVYDNSSEPMRGGSPAAAYEYVHDASNSGLAAAYNYALARAETAGAGWLLLLDQDTELTAEFLRELTALARDASLPAEVGAIVPRLAGRIGPCSPIPHFFDRLRTQFERGKPFPDVAPGLHRERLGALNSGASVRVQAMRRIGGFPQRFWLDYLDHAVFHRLYSEGYGLYVMQSRLRHQLSVETMESARESVSLDRLRNIVLAETLFVKLYGGRFERLLYRIYLADLGYHYLRDFPDKRFARLFFRHALLLPLPPERS